MFCEVAHGLFLPLPLRGSLSEISRLYLVESQLAHHPVPHLQHILPNSNQSHAIRTTTIHTMSGSEPIKGGKSYAPAP